MAATNSFDRMADVFRVLADASRLAILHCIIKEGEVSVSRIVESTGRSQANVSKHLKVMTDAGVVVRRKEGLVVYYKVFRPQWAELCRIVREQLLIP